MGITAQEKAEPAFLEAYQETIHRAEDGRYMVLFPIKIGHRKIESNRNIAMIWLQGLLGKTQLEDKLKYHEIFQQYSRDGFIEEAHREFDVNCTYLPQSIKVSAEPTKIRPVFDGWGRSERKTQHQRCVGDRAESKPGSVGSLVAVPTKSDSLDSRQHSGVSPSGDPSGARAIDQVHLGR